MVDCFILPSTISKSSLPTISLLHSFFTKSSQQTISSPHSFSQNHHSKPLFKCLSCVFVLICLEKQCCLIEQLQTEQVMVFRFKLCFCSSFFFLYYSFSSYIFSLRFIVSIVVIVMIIFVVVYTFLTTYITFIKIH